MNAAQRTAFIDSMCNSPRVDVTAPTLHNHIVTRSALQVQCDEAEGDALHAIESGETAGVVRALNRRAMYLQNMLRAEELEMTKYLQALPV